MRLCGLLLFGMTLVGMGAAQDSNFAVGPQYLMNYGSPLFMRPIATPSLSLSEAATVTVAAPEVSSYEETSPAIEEPTNYARIFWGGPERETNAETSEVIEISGAIAPPNLPESIINVGVQETVDAQGLRERGYGVTVSEASALWKGHEPHAVRTFTNRDVEKLRE